MKTNKLILLILPTILLSTPNHKKEYCYAITKEDKYIGLTKFNTKEEFIQNCNGKLYFIYKEDKCRVFTMKKMKFDIYIKDKTNTRRFKIGEQIEVCGKSIQEFVK